MFTSPKRSKDRSAAAGGTLGDGLANGAEFAGTILVFTLIGWLLDRAFDAKPWFIIGLTMFGIVGQFVRTWYTYDAEMKAHEATRLSKVNGRQAAPANGSDAASTTSRSIEEAG